MPAQSIRALKSILLLYCKFHFTPPHPIHLPNWMVKKLISLFFFFASNITLICIYLTVVNVVFSFYMFTDCLYFFLNFLSIIFPILLIWFVFIIGINLSFVFPSLFSFYLHVLYWKHLKIWNRHSIYNSLLCYICL